MHIISKQGSADNVLTYEHICDTAADMAAIERKYITLGSVCIVLQGESGAMEVYMADSDKEWHDVIVTGGSGSGSGESAPAGLSLYICTSSEVANGKPDVDAPAEGVLYLVPSGNESGNLYNEYVYVNDAWELFGGASIDLTGYATQAWISQQGYLTSHQDISGKADKTDTVLETTLSRGRKDNTTAGGASLAFGVNTEASGYYSVALGLNTTASSQGAFAEGKETVAHYIAHAEGEDTQALGQWAHSQGVGTVAKGAASFSGGDHTIANGNASFVFGRYNAADSYDNWPTWTANTSYEVGDRVKRNMMVQNQPTDVGYHCTVANSDATFDIDHWELDGYHMNYAEIVGNGKQYEDPETHQMVRAGSNAYALEWDGTAHFAGDVYVGANSDSTGGVKVATVNQIPTSVSQLTNNSGFVSPASQPTEDGTALVYVNGAWKAQKGYGYGDTTKSSLFSFTAADFTGDGRSGEYETTINLYEIMQDLTEEEQEELNSKLVGIFFSGEEFEVKINNTVYNSINNNFEYRISSELGGSDIVLRNPNQTDIFALRIEKEGIVFYVYDVEPTSAEIIVLSKNYTPISKDLFPDMPVKKGFAEYSIVEGQDTIAIGSASHAEGMETRAFGENSHVEGQRTKAKGINSHAEGIDTIAEGDDSHAEGAGEQIITTITSTANSYEYQVNSNFYDIKVGHFIVVNDTPAIITEYNYAEHIITVSEDLGSFNNEPVIIYSGAGGECAHSEGENTTAFGKASHAEGSGTTVFNSYAHAEGYETTASGDGAHAEGDSTIASGFFSHAEGSSTAATEYHAHAEGSGTVAEGEASHAEGAGTTASAFCSHAEGQGTTSTVMNQHVQGKYNIADTPNNNHEGIYADIVGNGEDLENLSNAYALTWTGDGHYAGDVYVHSNSDSTGGNKLATEAYVTNAISASTETVSGATPTVTAVANKQYICGTVSTLSFTPASSGISDILFTSGSTATILTIPNTVKFPEWFDPSNLSANTTYEISVMNGTYGAVMAWATT